MGIYQSADRIIDPTRYPWGYRYLIDLIKTITTQSDWQEGTLTGVEADSGDYLRLAEQYALEFDGNGDYVEIPSSADLNPTNNFSVSAWFYAFDGTSRQAIFHKWESPYTDQILLRLGNGNILFYINDGTTTGPASTNYNTNEWIHVVAVYDSSDGLYLYVNSTQESYYEHVGDLDDAQDKIGLGGHIGGDTLDGKLSNVLFYEKVLSQTEINSLYAGDVPTGSLVGHWPMNEGSGSTVYDESTNNNDGTIHGATWTTSYLFGNRTQQFDLSNIGTVGSSKISWVETLNSQNITIETRLSTDSGSTWTSWAEATNGDPIPDLSEGTDVSNGLLECRQTLSTSDPSTTPELDELKIEVYA